jgi:archaellum biogenesis protein FlaJ (TadC family)
LASVFFWIGLLVSTVLWAVGSWLSGILWPGDGVTAFIVGFIFAVIGGGVVMMMLKMRGLRSGRYEKASWGVRRR